MNNLKVRAVSAPWWSGVNFLVQSISPTGVKSFGEVVLTANKYEGEFIQPTFTLDMNAAQNLMDDLWNCGIRPTEGTGSAGALKAVENHLEDMRKLLFHKEGIK